MAKKKERVIVYIDGFNLYYGLRDSGWRKYYWLDLYKTRRIALQTQSATEPCQVLHI